MPALTCIPKSILPRYLTTLNFTSQQSYTQKKIRGMINAAAGARVDGMEIIKTIVVPKKLVNFVEPEPGGCFL